MREAAIGVFDSGVGGISVLREAMRRLPRERFVYYGDNANAPYGTRPSEEILRLTVEAVRKLLARDVKALVIACNTATSVAAPYLRQKLSIPIVAMEPALKPAQALRRGGKILVLATPATLSLPKFQGLLARYGQEAIPVPVRGLVERIERGQTGGAEMEGFLRDLLEPFAGEKIDCVVLGCTHYIFVREAFARVLGAGVALIDGNAGTVRRLESLLGERGELRPEGEGGVELCTSGEEATLLPLMEKLLRG